MDKLSMAIIAMEAHVACSNDRLRQAWDIIYAKLVEENGSSHNTARKEILLCTYTGFCLANQHGICTDACFCNCQRKTSSVA